MHFPLTSELLNHLRFVRAENSRIIRNLNLMKLSKIIVKIIYFDLKIPQQWRKLI